MTIEVEIKNNKKIYKVDVGNMPIEKSKKYFEQITKELEIKNDTTKSSS